MPFTDISVPNNSKFDVVTFDIIADGQAIDPAIEIMSISIIKEVNRIPSAKIVIRDGDPAKGSFDESQKDTFLPGKKIQKDRLSNPSLLKNYNMKIIDL